jgi:hypothetical protein
MSITERIAALVERVRADEGALGKLSTGEALAAVLVLDRKTFSATTRCWKPSSGSATSGSGRP